MLGMQTGFPLYVVGTSTYGVSGGLFMPGLLMGLLQFGWLAVNAFAVSIVLCECLGIGQHVVASGAKEVMVPGVAHGAIAATVAIAASFIGLKGIQYVAKVATYLPLIPLVVLVVLLVKTCGGLGNFQPQQVIEAKPPVAAAEAADKAGVVGPVVAHLNSIGVVAVLLVYVVGFFATAGTAGTDIAAVGRNGSDVQWGGLMGIVLPTIVAGGASLLVIAGACGDNLVAPDNQGILNPVKLMPNLLV